MAFHDDSPGIRSYVVSLLVSVFFPGGTLICAIVGRERPVLVVLWVIMPVTALVVDSRKRIGRCYSEAWTSFG